ncbi:MAG: Rnase Y domain-containing protein, partial [Micrococcales bacterium]|nr:Rnase Y domain-containing protein [Micrococcales bacterium]
MEWATVLVVIGLLVACAVALALVRTARHEAEGVRRQANEDAATLREEAQAKIADSERREQRLMEREEVLAERERSLSHDRTELDAAQRRAHERAEALTTAEHTAERLVAEAERAAAERSAEAERSAAERVAEAERAARAELEAVAGLTAEEAKALLIEQMTAQARLDAAAQVRQIAGQARATADARARRVVASAVQRLAVPTSSQAVTTAIPLPSEEMKG